MRLPRMLPVLALASGLAAQTPPGDALKSYLNLQDAQIQTLQQIRQQQMQAAQSAFSELAAKQKALRDQLEAGSTDAVALGKLLLEAEAVRKRVQQIHDTYRAQAVNVLSAEQKTKLAALEQAQKLAPAIAEATALGLLNPPEMPGFRGAGMPGIGPGLGPMRRPAAPGMAPGAAPLRQRIPRGFPPIEQ